MLLCQISDPHTASDGTMAYGRIDTAQMLAGCVRKILSLARRPDAVVVTGDLTYSSTPAEYGALADLLAPLPMPVHLVIGNHDDRTAFHAAFPQYRARTGGGFVQYVVDDMPVRLVVLDTVVSGKPHGELCSERLAWLDRTLAADRRPTVIAQHHPPLVTGMQKMDAMTLVHPEREAEVVARHPHVERILCGHYHRPIYARFAGTLATVCPSTAHQLQLRLLPEDDLGFTFEPPAFMLHLWNGSELVTHMEVVDEFEKWGTKD